MFSIYKKRTTLEITLAVSVGIHLVALYGASFLTFAPDQSVREEPSIKVKLDPRDPEPRVQKKLVPVEPAKQSPDSKHKTGPADLRPVTPDPMDHEGLRPARTASLQREPRGGEPVPALRPVSLDQAGEEIRSAAPVETQQAMVQTLRVPASHPLLPAANPAYRPTATADYQAGSNRERRRIHSATLPRRTAAVAKESLETHPAPLMQTSRTLAAIPRRQFPTQPASSELEIGSSIQGPVENHTLARERDLYHPASNASPLRAGGQTDFIPAPLQPVSLKGVGKHRDPSHHPQPFQTAAIPSGFKEENLKGKQQGMTGEAEIAPSAEALGKIRQGFTQRVWQKIARTKYYPRLAHKRGVEGEPVVAFTLGSEGSLLELSLAQTSGHRILDRAAIQTVRDAVPYPAIPTELEVKSIRFKLPISFILEKP